jgi:YfiH family protein
MEAGRILDTDGIFSSDPNLVCSIQVADCMPVYFVHQLDPVFGLVHAGWRGLVNGILLQSAKQIEEKGISLSNFDILIGPSIQKCCFEVSDDVINQFDSNFIEKKWAGKYRIDLQKLALHQLVKNGFKRERITTLTECTYCDTEKYHSYRRNGKKAGRMIGLLGYC